MEPGSAYARQRNDNRGGASRSRPRPHRTPACVHDLPYFVRRLNGRSLLQALMADDDPHDRVVSFGGTLGIDFEHERTAPCDAFTRDAENRHEHAPKLGGRHGHDGRIRREAHGAYLPVGQGGRQLPAQLAYDGRGGNVRARVTMRANGRRQLSRETHCARERLVERAHLREHWFFDPDVLAHACCPRRDDEQCRRQFVDEHWGISDEKLLACLAKNPPYFRFGHAMRKSTRRAIAIGASLLADGSGSARNSTTARVNRSESDHSIS